MSFHIAESREQARNEARDGLLRWHNEYTVGTLMRPGAVAFKTPTTPSIRRVRRQARPR